MYQNKTCCRSDLERSLCGFLQTEVIPYGGKVYDMKGGPKYYAHTGSYAGSKWAAWRPWQEVRANQQSSFMFHY